MDFDKKFDSKNKKNDLNKDDIRAILGRLGFKPKGSIDLLYGGYSCLNFKFKHGNDDLVFRASSKSVQDFLGEISILRRARGLLPVPEVWAAEVFAPEINKNIAVVSFMEGALLSQVEDRMEPSEIKEVALSIGEQLAKIHKFEFTEAGFFGEGGIIVKSFSPFIASVVGHMQKLLGDPLLNERLGGLTMSKLSSYIKLNKSVLEALPSCSNLTHSDFNQKNILVSKVDGQWKVSAILDWEFAFSGSPMIDFGNFFRYELEMSPYYREPLLESYKYNGGQLSDTWREQSKYLDLLSMMQFLISKDVLPKTFHTAKTIIHNTLEFK